MNEDPSIQAASYASGPALGGYDILGEIGHGGMGVVYRAFDRARGALVALKTMRMPGPAALHRFKREFRSLADVAHPNLVTLYELISDGRDWFIVMEFVEGVSFLEYVHQGAGLPRPPALTSMASGAPSPADEPTVSAALPRDDPESTARDQSSELQASTPGSPGSAGSAEPLELNAVQRARLRKALRQLAEGVAALHGAGRLHRDLKPSNVLVTGTGRVVILDFGLAAELGPTGQHQSSSVHVLGTPAYMPPEQAAGAPVSPASDWYSVGVMLYEALTGRLPFLGQPLEVLMDKQRFEPPSPRELIPRLPEDLCSLCTDLLRRDPKARPSQRDVLRRLGNTPGEPENPKSTPPQIVPLVGRDREFQALESAFAAVKRGQTVVLMVQGRSGVGKTALVHRFIDGLNTRDEAVVLMGRCYEREAVPYKALDSLIDALSHYLKRWPASDIQGLLPRDIRPLMQVFPALRHIVPASALPRCGVDIPDPHELRRRAFAGLRELMARLGDRKPLVLFIDDLQWSDQDSASLLSEIMEPPDPPLVLLIGCYRSEETETIRSLRLFVKTRNENAPLLDQRELAIEAIKQEEAEALAVSLLGRVDSTAIAEAAAIARESGGNPFFIYELVRHIQAGYESGGSVMLTEGVALDEVLWARVCRLPEGSRRLLEVVAVSGRPIGETIACQAAELASDDRSALALLRSGRLIRSTGQVGRAEIETYHDRVRETVVAHVEPASLKDHHLRLALALEESTTSDPEILAIHFQGATEHRRAGKYFVKAADQAADMLAFERAIKLYQLALQSSSGGDAEAHQLRIKLGDALANAGRGAEAAREYLAAIPGSNAALARGLRRRAAQQYLISGHIDEGLAALRSVLAEVGMRIPDTPRRALWSLLWQRAQIRLRGLAFQEREPSLIADAELTKIDVCWAAGCGLTFSDAIRGADFQSRSLLLALRCGEPFRVARALAVEAGHVSSDGPRSWRRADRLIRAAEEQARRSGHPHALGVTLMAKGGIAHLQGRWAASITHSDEAEAMLRERCTGVAWELNAAHSFALWSMAHAGRVADLGQRRQALLNEAFERGDRHAVTTLSCITLDRLAADDAEGALGEMRDALSEWRYPGFHVQHCHALNESIDGYLYLGDPESARSYLEERWPLYSASLLQRVQRFRVDTHYSRSRLLLALAARSANPHQQLRSALSDARRLDREGVAWARALAFLLRAGAAAILGQTARAVTLLMDAAKHLDAVDMPLHAAAARRRLGELIGGDAGTALIAEVDAWMSSQGIRRPARLTTMYLPGRPD
ncbi:MAG: serine/threonine-protein kinase PknK [Isosphaeraceae bacterium]